MARFRIVNGHTKIEDICIDSSAKPENGQQRRIPLEYAPWVDGKPPEFSTPGNFIRIGGVSHNAKTRTTRFWIEPLRDAQGVGYVLVTPGDAILRVTVGKVTNQYAMKVDLIADLGRSEDPRLLWIYQRILAKRNNDDTIPRDFWDRAPTDEHPGYGDQPLKQITDLKRIASWDCGATLDRFGAILRSNHAQYYAGRNIRYYKPFYSKKNQENRVTDVDFDAAKVRHGAESITRLVEKDKTAVTLFALHGADGFGAANGEITHPGTHFITVVGCSDVTSDGGRTYLIVDPWPRGSMINYTSGIFGAVHSTFMAFVYYIPGEPRIASRLNEGNHHYTVLSGPP